MDDLKPESLWKFRVMEFGPLLVAMDSHGGRLYTAVKKTGQARRRAGEPWHEVIRRVMAAICHRRRFQSRTSQRNGGNGGTTPFAPAR